MALSELDFTSIKLLRDQFLALRATTTGIRERILPQNLECKVGYDRIWLMHILVDLDAALGNAAVELDMLITDARITEEVLS